MITATTDEQGWLAGVVAECQAHSDAAGIVQDAMYAEARDAREAARTAREAEGWQHWHTASMKRDAVDQAGNHAYQAVLRRHRDERIARDDRERVAAMLARKAADRVTYKD